MNPINQPQLGKELYDLRMKKGMTQQELREESHVSVRTIQRIESGAVTPRTVTIKILLKALGENVEEWFARNQDTDSDQQKGASRLFLTNASDRRLKMDIEDLASPLEKTTQLRGVSYKWKDTSKSQRTQIGVIAQEVEKVYPEFVHTNDEGMKAVNYAQMTAILIEAVKELNKKVEVLESENASLKTSLSEIATLKNQVNQLMEALGTSKAASK